MTATDTLATTEPAASVAAPPSVSTPATPPAAVTPVAAPEAKPSTPEKAAAEQAKPETPAFDFKIPPGAELSEEHRADLIKFAMDRRLDATAAQALFDRDVARAAAQDKSNQAVFDKMKSDAEAVARADPIIGGEKFDATRAEVQRMIEKHQDPRYPLWEGMTGWGLDRDPATLHFFHNLFERQREPNSIVTGGSPATPSKSITEMFFGESMGTKKE